MRLNLYRIAYPVTSLGPGNRIVLWVAGCKKQCRGCISPEMQDFDSGKMIEVKILLKHLLKIKHPIDGITISGGEPFEQLPALNNLLKGIHEHKPEWNIIVYTGYKMSELLKGRGASLNIFKFIDVLIDGEYQMDVPSKHPITGSGNQKIYLLTELGQKMKHQINSLSYNRVNLGISSGCNHMLIGIMNQGIRHKITRFLGISNAGDDKCLNM
jgi:anaerobic ribonucleoside-triphosphate reductase activating protein